MPINPVKYIVILIGVFGFIFILMELFEKAYEMPDWVTPRLAAMWVTFAVALLWLLKAMAPAPAPAPF